jgi:hypothetical protein
MADQTRERLEYGKPSGPNYSARDRPDRNRICHLELEPGESRRRRRDHIHSVEETMAESEGMATCPRQGINPPPASAAELAHGEDCGPTLAWETGLYSTKSIQTDIIPTDR